jgi:putative oxidoreductase
MADRSMSMPVSKPGMVRNIAGWILCIVLAFAFVMAGGMKLIGNQAMVQLFDQVGVGQWFRYFTGALEAGAGIGVLIPQYSRWAALLLAAVMIGAIITHLTILHSSPASPCVLLVVALAAAFLRG